MLTECKRPMKTLRLFQHTNGPKDIKEWKALVMATEYQETRLGILGFLKGPKGDRVLRGSFQTIPAMDGSTTCTVHEY